MDIVWTRILVTKVGMEVVSWRPSVAIGVDTLGSSMDVMLVIKQYGK